MRYQIQDFVPYAQSLKWQIHTDYYQTRGAQAWLSQEVPYNVTSNRQAAHQNAAVLLAALQAQPPEANAPIRVLELGAGLGIFALNFLQTFRNLCHDAGVDYSQRLEYWMTDFAESALADIADHRALAEDLASGQLKLVVVDALQPQQARLLSGEEIALPTDFSAIVGNYQHSTLPVTLLLHQLGQYFEKHISLYYQLTGSLEQPPTETENRALLMQIVANLALYSFEVAPEHPQHLFFQALQRSLRTTITLLCSPPFVAALTPETDLRETLETLLLETLAAETLSLGVPLPLGQEEAFLQDVITNTIVAPLFAFEAYQLDRIAETSRFQTCVLEAVVTDPLGQQAVATFAEQYPLATILYPIGSLQSLQALRSHMRPGGVFLISDKGFAHPARMEGIHEEVATTHGNSLAHPVNFPLIARWATLAGWGQTCTHDETNALQTLLLYPEGPLPATLEAAFDAQFVSHNANMDSHFLLEAGYLFLKQGDLEQAGHYFTRALRLRPSDAPLLYLTAVAMLNRGRHVEALEVLRRPHDDAFGVLNFAILEAEACRTLGLHAEAVEAYHRALAGYGESSVVYYNLALSLEALEEPEAARSALLRAAELDPEDTDIQLALSEVSADA